MSWFGFLLQMIGVETYEEFLAHVECTLKYRKCIVVRGSDVVHQKRFTILAENRKQIAPIQQCRRNKRHRMFPNMLRSSP